MEREMEERKEREVRGREGEGRGRRGREMRRGIIVGGMALLLVLGCNNGAIEELEKKNESILSISNLRQGFLDIFTTFGGMVNDSFGINAETTKKGVGEELGKVGEAVQTVKDKLEKIKVSENYNIIKEKSDEAITKVIETLGKIVDGANKIKQATASAGGKIANASQSNNGNAKKADETSAGGLVEGINMIYGAAKESEILSEGKTNKEIDASQEVGKLFHNSSTATANALKGANRAVLAASGADILSAIGEVKNISKTVSDIQNATNAFEIAIAANSNNDLSVSVKTNASVIAAGLALRAMAKDGELATVASHAPGKEVNAILIEVVGKTVNEIISTIRKTVDKCLKNVNDCIREGSNSEVKSK